MIIFELNQFESTLLNRYSPSPHGVATYSSSEGKNLEGRGLVALGL